MALADLLSRMESQAIDTPDTPCNPIEVSAKPAPNKACTLDTPDTSQNISAEDWALFDAWLFHFIDRDDLPVLFVPPVDHGKALSCYPDAVAAEPIPESFRQPEIEEAPDAIPDDRRTCRQCLNLRGRACSIAKPGGLVSANRGYQPNPETLQRCAGYLPNGTGHDQQTGQ